MCPSSLLASARSTRALTQHKQLESPSLKPQPLSLFAAHLLLPLLWNDDEMKWWLMKQMLGLVFLWNFFILYGVLKLNCYMSKKCRKSFLGASRPWAREACGPRPCGGKFGSRVHSSLHRRKKQSAPALSLPLAPFHSSLAISQTDEFWKG